LGRFGEGFCVIHLQRTKKDAAGRGAMVFARVYKASQSLEELAKGFYGHWKDRKWVPAAISARYRARLRKETLLSGQ
jgi:hypothetical protein